ncbi:TRAP transporter large permease [Desulfoferrobacter suflitae]|uniref:TRAP transporter large permease n=1 Tax=Desulfoferrobacter suflitae TaxID=2865782 RepID=UPI002164CB64|nr:TRAP transporter large permease subunit [Desulfoferrobacter suflitae]MCK8601681.1 TRAP transporter large permease subunit [Desulfoferrobacter suflitae]
MTYVISALLVLLALSGTPLFIVISAAALVSFYVLGVDLSVVIIEMYRLAANPMLIALVLFAFAGYVLAESGASTRLVKLSRAVFGRMPGGLAVVTLVVCALFTALTGASGVTIVALGGILLPALLADSYSEKFSLGLLTSSGSLGVLFPPSLPLIIYGVVTETSIPHLFLAGLLPGLLMVVLLSLYGIHHGRHTIVPTRFSSRNLRQAAREAFWEMLLPVVVFGGIFGGFLVLSEAAAITVAYVLLVEMGIHREVKLNDMPAIVIKTVMMVGGIIVILGASLAFNSFLIDQQVPNRILELMRTYVDNKYVFLLILNFFLLIVGCVLDVFSALVIVVPLIVPLAASYEVNVLHLGIIFLTNLQIGYSTPPIGMNLFIASLRFDRPIVQLSLATLPFLGILLLALAIITFFPPLSLVLIH